MSKISPDQILAGLNDQQRAAATSLNGPVRILAGAGTGKTRTITHRLAYAVATGTVEQNRTLSLTFTAKAAAEMRSRVGELGLPGAPVRTFHSAALAQLSYFWAGAFGGSRPTLTASKSATLAEVVSNLDLLSGTGKPLNTQLLRTLAGEIEWAKSSLISPENYVINSARRELRMVPSSPQLSGQDFVAQVYQAYEDHKRFVREIDFEDVLLLTAGMLREDQQVRRQVHSQYRFFTVDEYQDVSPLQQLLLDQWLGTRKEICVVGDPAQTIYSFAGATSAFLLNFERKYPEALTIDLNQSYRSGVEIINYAGRIVEVSLRAAPESAVASQIKPVREHGFSDEAAEFRFVADELAGQVSESAVLARTNAQLEKLQRVLSARGIKSSIKANEKFFERQEVIDLIRAFRAASVLPDEDWMATAKSIAAPFGDSDYILAITQLISGEFASLRAFLAHLDELAAGMNPPELPGVTLSTIHSAKGSEWEKVYLIGAANGTLPLISAKSGAEVEEERRLLYVALTRAKSELVISWNGERSHLLPSASGPRI